MRVLFLFPHMVNYGGALHYQLHAAEELAARGETVGILTLRHDPTRISIPDGIEVIVPEHGPLTSELAYWLLAPLWQRRLEALAVGWKPDVLVPQVFPSNWWGWRMRRRHPETRLLWICHEPSAFIHSERWIAAIRPAWKRWLAKALRPITRYIDMTGVAYSDAIVGNSEASRQLGIDVYRHVEEGPAYPGVDLERFPVNHEARSDVLVTSGLLSSFKRVDFLIDVVAGLRQRRPELRLDIVGQGPDEGSLKSKVQAMGLNDAVRFLGRVSDDELGESYRRARLYVHGAIDEPFGMSMVEALASGTPVAAHASGGPTEIVDMPGTGLLIDSVTVDDWVMAIDGFLTAMPSDPELSARCRAQAATFNWQRCGDRLHRAIDDLCGKTVD